MTEVKISSEVVRYGAIETTIDAFEAYENHTLLGYKFKCPDIDRVVSNDSINIGMYTMREALREKFLK